MKNRKFFINPFAVIMSIIGGVVLPSPEESSERIVIEPVVNTTKVPIRKRLFNSGVSKKRNKSFVRKSAQN